MPTIFLAFVLALPVQSDPGNRPSLFGRARQKVVGLAQSCGALLIHAMWGKYGSGPGPAEATWPCAQITYPTFRVLPKDSPPVNVSAYATCQWALGPDQNARKIAEEIILRVLAREYAGEPSSLLVGYNAELDRHIMGIHALLNAPWNYNAKWAHYLIDEMNGVAINLKISFYQKNYETPLYINVEQEALFPADFEREISSEVVKSLPTSAPFDLGKLEWVSKQDGKGMELLSERLQNFAKHFGAVEEERIGQNVKAQIEIQLKSTLILNWLFDVKLAERRRGLNTPFAILNAALSRVYDRSLPTVKLETMQDIEDLIRSQEGWDSHKDYLIAQVQKQAGRSSEKNAPSTPAPVHVQLRFGEEPTDGDLSGADDLYALDVKFDIDAKFYVLGNGEIQITATNIHPLKFVEGVGRSPIHAELLQLSHSSDSFHHRKMELRARHWLKHFLEE